MDRYGEFFPHYSWLRRKIRFLTLKAKVCILVDNYFLHSETNKNVTQPWPLQEESEGMYALLTRGCLEQSSKVKGWEVMRAGTLL